MTLRDRLIEIATADISPPASLGASGRAAFKSYLESGPNKAFAVSGAHYGWVSGRRSSDDAVKDALGNCQAHAPGLCATVNVNDRPAAK